MPPKNNPRQFRGLDKLVIELFFCNQSDREPPEVGRKSSVLNARLQLETSVGL
jgi:hypothetical protein